MEMVKCDKGHYYDASIHMACPYCNEGRNREKTVAMGITPPGFGGAPQGQAAPGPAPAAAGSGKGTTIAIGVPMPDVNQAQGGSNGNKTMAIFEQLHGMDPVVGWLVQINGDSKGKDYRIHSDNNYIGRSEKMDICIKGDDTISRENQAIIVYDSLDKKYYLAPGEGRSIIRINGKALLGNEELKNYDKLTIGSTEFIFMALCGENFAWEL